MSLPTGTARQLDGGLRVRPAGTGDGQKLLALMQELSRYEGADGAMHASLASFERDGFGARPRFHAMLAELGGETLGYVTYTIGYSIWAAGSVVLVDDLFVVSHQRGTGVGRRLMQAVGAVCRQDGHALVRWTVETDNRSAIRFYEGLGARVRAKGVCTWIPRASIPPQPIEEETR